MPRPRMHPLNAPGDFYVEEDMCIACGAPEKEAPDLMSHLEAEGSAGHCYFHRQPQTPAEVQRAVNAVVVSCCASVRYAGTDKKILAAIARLNRACSCDAVNPPEAG